ncbi:Bug family tripartite tricarboxylate transporter substrate binding protein [Roseomonas marmotae]|uniref:Tripartite tricarboxylate transporter substrate binding protein n=1 Tax=Roseomonas marmotae TaxID=2768161 RepID=A0ABS3KF35_9PROT|nr:tripartite tricarboxylate transporter substrate binding protein [Roseomonas marmotae]MBO1076081.1 tripartite tricarboxylate transporter substrate binding protein [Roseomonas marmotae]QTI81320.1 tripartite tricarboxylate transporter substrate binding protein [Roseomonas marmotae]
MLLRRMFLGSAGAVALAGAARSQPAYPDRPIRLICPYPAGGATDVLTRILAEGLRERLGQPVVVENRSGAGGNIGVDVVAKADPDGYVLGTAPVGNFVINPFLYSNMPYEPMRDLTPVSLVWEVPNVAVVSEKFVPARTLKDFLAWAKEKKGGVVYGTSGVGTTAHLCSELLFKRAGVACTHVPFRSAAQVIPAMLSGDVDFAIDNLASYAGVIQQGQMAALGMTTAERWPTMPQVPTMTEAGMPGFVVTAWSALIGPAGLPAPIQQRLAAAVQSVAADPAIQQRFLVAGGQALSTTPAGARERMERERPMWKEMVELSGARMD